MNQANVHKKFIFNEKIDGDYLFSLYENDFVYIAEVFSSSLDSLKEETGHFTSAYETSDILALKHVVHKLTPVFGFTGLLHHQEMMSRFEHLCGNAGNISNITMQYMELTELIKEGKTILKEDYNRLTEFIS
jgi:hypothetical protein